MEYSKPQPLRGTSTEKGVPEIDYDVARLLKNVYEQQGEVQFSALDVERWFKQENPETLRNAKSIGRALGRIGIPVARRYGNYNVYVFRKDTIKNLVKNKLIAL